MIVSRRNFLRNAAGVALAPAALAACSAESLDPHFGERFMRAFFKLLAERGIGEAYARTTSNFKKRHSLVSFATLVYDRGIDGPMDQRWLNQAWSYTASFGSVRGRASVSGWIINRRYERLRTSAKIDKIYGTELLDELEIAAAPMLSETVPNAPRT